MNENMQTLHFSFGPVQDFIGQARRTRDLWVGSYLLSYLSARAMKEISEPPVGGRIVFPDVEKDPIIRALRGEITPNKNAPPDTPESLAARTGSLPNRFMAEVPIGITGKEAEAAITKAWAQIAKTVHTKFKGKACSDWNGETEEIWSRQILNLWNFTWVMGEDHHGIDQRKHLRSFFSDPEPGQKCTICGEREALRGEKQDYYQVREWWKTVTTRFNEGKGLHFAQDGKERLCAVCTIKRVFPLVAEEAIGWKLNHNYPSTAYLSAIDWIKAIMTAGNELKVSDGLQNFIKVAKTAKVDCSETTTQISSLSQNLKDLNGSEWKTLSNMDGDAFFPDAIRNENTFLPHLPHDLKTREMDQKRVDLLNALNKLTASTDKMEAPSPFYALLLMDGDKMGNLLSAYPKESTSQEKENWKRMIAEALAEFTAKVPKIVYQHDGVLVYAGGDDVFAFMPLPQALKCASALRIAYQQAFLKKAPQARKTTISAAIIYAHMNSNLRAVIKDVHELLEKVAKNMTGRDAFAVRVWKRGGPILTLAKPWSGIESDWISEIENIQSAFEEGEYSSSFFYRLRELFNLLEPEDVVSIFPEDEAKIKLLAAEYMKSRERSISIDEAEKRTGRLLRLCRIEKWKNGHLDFGHIKPDGGLFLKFLAQKGV